MTADRRAALVEKVARLFAKNDECPWPYFTGTATAAIDLIRAEVLEEAAKELERFGGLGLAAKIRALKDNL